MSRRRRFRLAAALFALALGATAALVAMAPRLLSGRLPAWLEEDFGVEHAGRLEVGELHLDWTGTQRAEGLVLYDPDGVVVARGRAVFPGLFGWLARGVARPGAVRVELEAEVVRGADGRTNLARALERTVPAVPSKEIEVQDLDLAVRADRLAWRDEVRGTAVELTDLELDWTRADGTPDVSRIAARVDGTGRFELAADASRARAANGWPERLELRLHGEGLPSAALPAGAGALAALGPAVDVDLSALLSSGAGAVAADLDTGRGRARVELDLRAPPGAALAGSARVSATGLAAEALDAWLGTPGLLAEALGESFDGELTCDFDGTGAADLRGPFDARLTSPRASVAAAGRLDGGRVLTGPDGGLTASMDLGPVFGARVLRPLVPLAGVPVGAHGAPVSVALRDVSVALDAPRDFTARLELAVGPTTLALAPAFQQAFGAPLGLSLDGRPFRLSLGGGRATYDELALVLGGERVPLTGGLDLATGALELDLALPVRLLTARLRQDLGPAGALLGDNLAVGVEVRGARDAPTVRLVPPDAGGLEDALRGILGGR